MEILGKTVKQGVGKSGLGFLHEILQPLSEFFVAELGSGNSHQVEGSWELVATVQIKKGGDQLALGQVA